MHRYSSGGDVVAERSRAKEHITIEHVDLGGVKGDNVVLLDHVKRT